MTEWKEISPGIYGRAIPMDKRKATLETLERLEAAGARIPQEVRSLIVRGLSLPYTCKLLTVECTGDAIYD